MPPPTAAPPPLAGTRPPALLARVSAHLPRGTVPDGESLAEEAAVSVTRQSVERLGGRRSVLAHQGRDHAWAEHLSPLRLGQRPGAQAGSTEVTR